MFNFAIDRGGTFTDVYARLPSGETKVTIFIYYAEVNFIHFVFWSWTKVQKNIKTIKVARYVIV